MVQSLFIVVCFWSGITLLTCYVSNNLRDPFLRARNGCLALFLPFEHEFLELLGPAGIQDL
jgi:hypothetical protein